MHARVAELKANHRGALRRAADWTRTMNRARKDHTREKARMHADIAWNSARSLAYQIEIAERKGNR